MKNTSALRDHYERIIAKAWADDGFKAQLLADPAAVAAAEGIAVPAGVKIVEHEGPVSMMRVVVKFATTDPTAWS